MKIERPLTDLGMNMYQQNAHTTALYPGSDRVIPRHELFNFMLCPNEQDITAMFYVLCKLAGEAGEVLEYVGKWLRGDFAHLDINRLNKELGDVQWYIAECARLFGLTLAQVGMTNLYKLQERAESNAIQGSGESVEERTQADNDTAVQELETASPGS